uniref:Uncharacterized protein n=1 Tax=Candidatus Methanogaster sp. ANME-2c ERB4 TaxID=2759911 RepID=A0A7G9YG42_9EURY|nr:hypothetical protein CLAIAILK_00038 [Methanosarcinales archaeon ANME-2c ERB4]
MGRAKLVVEPDRSATGRLCPRDPGCTVFCASERDCTARRLQDHDRIEGSDLVVTINVCCRIPAAAYRELKCDRGVGGGDESARARLRLLQLGMPLL